MASQFCRPAARYGLPVPVPDPLGDDPVVPFWRVLVDGATPVGSHAAPLRVLVWPGGHGARPVDEPVPSGLAPVPGLPVDEVPPCVPGVLPVLPEPPVPPMVPEPLVPAPELPEPVPVVPEPVVPEPLEPPLAPAPPELPPLPWATAGFPSSEDEATFKVKGDAASAKASPAAESISEVRVIPFLSIHGPRLAGFGPLLPRACRRWSAAAPHVSRLLRRDAALRHIGHWRPLGLPCAYTFAARPRRSTGTDCATLPAKA
jgi:hypothetical protein